VLPGIHLSTVIAGAVALTLALGPAPAFAAPERESTPDLSAVDPVGTFVEFDIPTPGSFPAKIAVGPDGAMWFTMPGTNRLGRVTMAGVVTDVPVAPGSFPDDIVAGPDGNVWFTESGVSRIGRFTPSTGVLVEFPLPTQDATPLGITTGPDGNLWFVENKNGEEKVGRITTSGVITEFPVTPNGDLDSITTGTDGNLWFTAPGTEVLARITTAGQFTDFPQPGTSGPSGLAVGADSRLWYSAPDVSGIGVAGADGTFGQFISGFFPRQPRGVAAAPDGALWFAAADNNGADTLVRVTTSGTVTEFPVPDPLAEPRDIAVGPDGNLWVTESGSNRVARVSTGVSPVVTAPTVTGGGVVGEVLTCGGDAYSLSPDSIATQWRRDTVDIPGATATTYTPVAADAGRSVSCVRTARLPAVLVPFSATSNEVLVRAAAAPGTAPGDTPPVAKGVTARWTRDRYRVRAGRTLTARFVTDGDGRFRATLTKKRRVVVSKQVRATSGTVAVRLHTRAKGAPLRPGRYVLRLLQSGAQLDRAVVRLR
jgi:streptogramin lyase